MTISSDSASFRHGDQPSRDGQHEDLIVQLSQLMQAEVDPEHFETALLQSALLGLNAPVGALWKRGESGDLNCLLEQSEPGRQFSRQMPDEWHSIRRDVLAEGRPRVARWTDPVRDSAGDTSNGDRQQFIFLQPLAPESPSAVLLEVHHRNELGPEALRNEQTFLTLLSDLHTEYLKGRRLKDLEVQRRYWQNVDAFSRLLQSLWNPPDVYAHVANGGREMCGYDRVTLLTGVGPHCRVQSVSCCDDPSRYSQTVQALQALCGLLTRANQSLQYVGGAEPMVAPEIQSRLNEVLQATGARILSAVPLRAADAATGDASTSVVGMLVAEHFRGQLDSAAESRLADVAAHAAPAVVRAAYWESLPGKWLLRGWIALRGSPIRRTRSAWRWILTGVAIAAAVLTFVPADFDIQATGQLQPVDQRHVFAPQNAIVRSIDFDNDEPLDAGDSLLTLEDPVLTLKLEEIRGERGRIETRLRTIQTLRANQVRGTNDPTRDDELAAEANELRQHRESLDAQWEIVQAQAARLQIVAPISGVVLTWNPQELLKSRPVVAGQRLLTVADLSGAWQLDVKIPESDLGHVRHALRDNDGTLPIDFALDAQVGSTLAATLAEERVARRAEIDPDLRHYFRAGVPLTATTEFEPLAGAEVSVRIHCGSRALGFVLFHDLYEWLQKNVFF